MSAASHWRLQTAPDLQKSSCPQDDNVSRLQPWKVTKDTDDGDGAASARSFLVYIPPKLCTTLRKADNAKQPHAPGNKALRVILALHGYGGRPLQEIKKWHEAATSLDAIILAPEGTDTASTHKLGWNAIHCCGDPVAEGVDDVDFATKGVVEVFLQAMGKYYVEKGNTEWQRRNVHVVATGFSNGGFLSSLLGLLPGDRRPPWLVGIVPTGGYQYDAGLYEGPPSGPSPLPVMMHHGGEDSIVNPDGCCQSPTNDSESNCPFDIGIRQETCTSVRTAFDMWARLNGCASTEKDEEERAVLGRRAKTKKVDTNSDEPIYSCWSGVGCIEPTNLCMWNHEGHSWGFQFPGSDMARPWMEGVFRRAETTASRQQQQPQHSTVGRHIFSEATIALLLLCAIILFASKNGQCLLVRGRKRKSSEEDSGEGDHIALRTLVASDDDS